MMSVPLTKVSLWCVATLHALAILNCSSVQPVQSPIDPPIKNSRLPPSLSDSSHSTHSPASNKPHRPLASPALSIEDRMVFSTSDESGSQAKSMEPVYNFRAQGMPLVDALTLFARINKLNIVAAPDIQGEITVDFHDLSLDRALAAILEVHGYYWERDEGLIQVRRLGTQVFHLDYIRLVRGGSGRNKAQITSGSGGSGPQGGTSSHDAGEIIVNQKVQIKFWEELEAQVQSLMSEEGRLVINRLSGTIQVTDRRPRMEEIATISLEGSPLSVPPSRNSGTHLRSQPQR